MIQYLAVPDNDSDSTYILYNTHSRILKMTEVATFRDTNSGQVRDVLRYVAQDDHASAGTLANSSTGTVLAIVNKNGHVTPICDPTP